MTSQGSLSGKAACRRRDSRLRVRSRAAKLLVMSTWASAVVGMAPLACAEPVDPYKYIDSATDDTFLRSLDGLGIDYSSGPEAPNTARAVCAYIQEGHSIREAVDLVRDSYPGLPLLKGAHFVAVARALYCPNSSGW